MEGVDLGLKCQQSFLNVNLVLPESTLLQTVYCFFRVIRHVLWFVAEYRLHKGYEFVLVFIDNRTFADTFSFSQHNGITQVKVVSKFTNVL